MTATVRTKNGRPNYYITIRGFKDGTGKNKDRWISTDIPIKGNNKRKAEEFRKKVLAEHEKMDELYNEITATGMDVLFDIYLYSWLEDLKQSIDIVTYDTYRLIVHNQLIPFFSPKCLKLKDVTSLHIQDYIKFKLDKVSPNTVRKHIWNLSKCFDTAIKQNLIKFNPVKGINIPKHVKFTGAKTYNERQIDELLETVKGDITEGIILFAIFYGMRRSEILGLKWSAIDFENKTFAINHTVVRVDKTLHKKDTTKNKASYSSMPLPDLIVSALKRLRAKQLENRLQQHDEYTNDEGYVFTWPDGRLILPNYVTKHFNKILVENSLPVIRFHDLRHSSGTYLLHLGFQMKEIQEWLRHEDISTTMNLYAHVDMEAKRGISETLNEKFQSFN